MENIVLTKYFNKIKKYVKENIDVALLTRYSENTYDKINKERENLTLYRDMVLNPELKENIVNMITDYALKFNIPSIKLNLPVDLRDEYFMNSVKEFLNVHQLILLAKKFNQDIRNEQIGLAR